MMTRVPMSPTGEGLYVSRGGLKLAHALRCFHVDVQDRVCADLGSHVGGFVDCLIQGGARRVYAVDTCYGTLAWKLRRDPRVVVMERHNALHVTLPEVVQLVTIDAGWTRQRLILTRAGALLAAGGTILTLVKPHYEAQAHQLVGGVLPLQHVDGILDTVAGEAQSLGLKVLGRALSPLTGHGGNHEAFLLLAAST